MENYRIESEEEINAYLAKVRYALNNGAKITFQANREIECNRNIKYTNAYTVAKLFPNENPGIALKRELMKLTPQNYIRTVKDIRFPKRSEMREFGKKYSGQEDVYIKIRVELFAEKGYDTHTVFIMSFHFAMYSFEDSDFPYKK